MTGIQSNFGFKGIIGNSTQPKTNLAFMRDQRLLNGMTTPTVMSATGNVGVSKPSFGCSSATSDVNNIQKYESLQAGINEIKTVYSIMENSKNIVRGKTLSVQNDKVCTSDGEPYNGVSKSIINPGVVLYGTFEDGKLNNVAVNLGKTYITYNPEENISKVYTSDSKGNEYFNTIYYDKNTKTGYIKTIAGNEQKVEEYYKKIDNVSDEINKTKRNPLKKVKEYVEIKKRFGEDAINDVIGRTALCLVVFGKSNQEEMKIYKDAVKV